MYSKFPVSLPVPLGGDSLELPISDWSVQAGFPSPADDHPARRLELADLLVEHPQATFVMRVRGLSAVGFGIDDNDWVIVDRAIRPRHLHIVIAAVDGEFTLKQLHNANGVISLKSGNPAYPSIVFKEGQELEIWGVVSKSVKNHI